jgi:hypothetical protein
MGIGSIFQAINEYTTSPEYKIDEIINKSQVVLKIWPFEVM